MRRLKKGNQWYFGMKAYICVYAGIGEVTSANFHDVDMAEKLIHEDDNVVNSGYLGLQKRPEMPDNKDKAKIEHDKSSVRCTAEHPFHP